MTTSWTFQNKNPVSHLLLEDGVSFLLLETGGEIVLEQTGTATSLWTLQTKN